MLLRDDSLLNPPLDLAYDEAILELAEAQQDRQGVLRLWEPDRTIVVVGRGSKVELEVEVERCRAEGVPVLRRCSGGATVVGGVGCLMYSVVLSYDEYPELRKLDVAHRFVMDRIAAAVRALGIDVQFQGTCDLTLEDRKVSGNALRCRRTHLLYHGTLLYQMDLSLLDRYLRMPERQPEYRRGRPHADFVATLPADRDLLKQSLIDIWQAKAPEKTSDEKNQAALLEYTRQFAAERYESEAWNYRL